MRFVVQVLATAGALWLSTVLVPGIELTGDTTADKVVTLLIVAAIFGLVNAVIKPIVQVLGCAFYVLTLGLFALVVNALLFLFTAWLADQLSVPFEVDGFWAAFWGAILVGVVSWLVGLVFPRRED